MAVNITPTNADQQLQEAKALIDGLPLANIGKSANEVFHYLGELDPDKYSAQTWFSLLELFQPTIYYIRHNLSKQYLGYTPSSSEKKPVLAQLSESIEFRYASAYAMGVSKLFKANEQKRSQKLLINLIYRSVRHLGYVFLISYMLYREPEDAYWRHLHRLYQLAVQEDIIDLKLDDEHAKIESSICEAYKHCLLLSSADPFHLRRNQIQQYHQALYAWAKYAKLSHSISEAALFLLNPKIPKGPNYRVLIHEEAHSESSLGLDPKPMAQEISQLYESGDYRVKVGKQKYLLSKDLLVYLINHFSTFVAREHPRTEQAGELNICVGLSATHYFLSGEQPFMPDKSAVRNIPEGLELREMLELQPISQTEENDAILHMTADPADSEEAWNPFSRSNLNLDGTHGHQSAEKKKAEKSETSKPKYQVYTSQLIDNSAAGTCLQVTMNDPTLLQTGELIGLQEPSNKYTHQWRIAYIRWLRCFDKKVLKMGLQTLSPSAVSIAAKIYRENPTSYLRALLLPDLINLNQASTLILPPLDAKAGDIAHIISQTLESEIRLTDCIRKNECFLQFTYETITTYKDEEAIPDDKKKNERTSLLDSVWDDLEDKNNGKNNN